VFTFFLPDYSSLKPWLLPVTYSVGICVATWLILRLYDHYSSYGLSLDGRQKEFFLSCLKRARRRITLLVGTGSLILMYYFNGDYSWRKAIALVMGLVLWLVIGTWD
jgi:hypothetical protein